MGHRLFFFFRAARALLVHELERLKLRIVKMVENREHFDILTGRADFIDIFSTTKIKNFEVKKQKIENRRYLIVARSFLHTNC